jgi:hypothetical protein
MKACDPKEQKLEIRISRPEMTAWGGVGPLEEEIATISKVFGRRIYDPKSAISDFHRFQFSRR